MINFFNLVPSLFTGIAQTVDENVSPPSSSQLFSTCESEPTSFHDAEFQVNRNGSHGRTRLSFDQGINQLHQWSWQLPPQPEEAFVYVVAKDSTGKEVEIWYEVGEALPQGRKLPAHFSKFNHCSAIYDILADLNDQNLDLVSWSLAHHHPQNDVGGNARQIERFNRLTFWPSPEDVVAHVKHQQSIDQYEIDYGVTLPLSKLTVVTQVGVWEISGAFTGTDDELKSAVQFMDKKTNNSFLKDDSAERFQRDAESFTKEFKGLTFKFEAR